MQVYAVILPRFRHGEKRCREAKEKELENFDLFDVYDEVADEGQETLGTNWVLAEKVKDNETMIKARLTIRGDQEDTLDVRGDSPTVRKSNINVFLMCAARMRWKIKSSDVTAAR